MTQYLTGHQEDCDLLKPHVGRTIQVTMQAPFGPYKPHRSRSPYPATATARP